MQTLSATGKRISKIPVPIDTIKTPQETPSSVLPFLGWERSVDIWNPDWPDQIKRNVPC
jgi:phage tail P2-like protein